MCELYPRYRSCCGIPLRIALIFIAVLSIITGALINAVLKKAGVDPSTIHSDLVILKNATINDFELKETYDEVLLESPSTEYIDTYEDLETTTRKRRRPKSRKTTTNGPYSTVEIIGEDGRRKRIRFTNDDDEDGEDPKQGPQFLHRKRRNKGGESARNHEETVQPFQEKEPPGGVANPPAGGEANPPAGGEANPPAGGEANPPVGDEANPPDGGEANPPDGGEANPPAGGEEKLPPEGGEKLPTGEEKDSGEKLDQSNKASATIKEESKKEEPKKEEPKKEPASVKFMRAVNTTGINLLGLLFIALGILLLVANFMNSPDLMFLYVVLCVAKSIVMLCLLISVIIQCSRARDHCLLSKLDWFSNFAVTIFWFLYSFVWAFFAAVANGYANQGWGNVL